jgi:amidohydrolase
MADMSELFGASPADGVYDEMVDLRRVVHRRPELSMEEHATTALIRDHMHALGMEEALGAPVTGGIFVMEGGRPGRTVALRADIDALPVHEESTRTCHSDVDGVMHACGHDVHVGSLLGTASVLAARREDLPGRYVFVFQPGEESLNGAQAMLDGGALSLLQGSRLVGFHVTSEAPTGIVALRGGIAMSEAHSLQVTLSGPGGHGASPLARGDVIQAAVALVGRLGQVVEGLRHEESDCVCSAGTLHAGTAVNVVPTSARVTGTLRTFTDEQREEALTRLRTLCDSVADERGVEITLELPAHTSAVVNDPAVTDLVEREAREMLGGEQFVARIPPTGPSDDVSEFLHHVPGCYFFVGGAARDGSSGSHHSPSFFVEDESLRIGTNVMVRSALALAAP